jgi:hypothetical protein
MSIQEENTSTNMSHLWTSIRAHMPHLRAHSPRLRAHSPYPAQDVTSISVEGRQELVTRCIKNT